MCVCVYVCVCVCITESLCYTSEISIANQLYVNKKPLWRTGDENSKLLIMA